MKTFRDLISEVAQPKSKDEIDFKARHEIEMIDHPESEEHQHTSEKRGRKRLADYEKGQDMSVYESVKFSGKTFTDYKTFNSDREANRFLEKNDDYGVIGTKGGKVYVAKMDDMGEAYDLEESFSVFKPMSPAPGRSVSNRVQVKAFKTSDAMNTFLAKGDNALHWKPTDKSGLKSGKYKMDMKRGSDGKPVRDFIREGSDVEENAFMGKAAAAKKAGKDKFKLGDKKFPVTMKKDTAKEIAEARMNLKQKAAIDQYMKSIEGKNIPKDLVKASVDALMNALKESEELDENLGKAAKRMKSFFGTDPKEIKKRLRDAGPDFIKKIATQKGELKGPAELQRRIAQKMLDESVNLIENFSQGTLTLDDGSRVTVSKQNADLLNQMLDELNPQNRRQMLKVAMEDEDGFNEILGFAREAL